MLRATALVFRDPHKSKTQYCSRPVLRDAPDISCTMVAYTHVSPANEHSNSSNYNILGAYYRTELELKEHEVETLQDELEFMESLVDEGAKFYAQWVLELEEQNLRTQSLLNQSLEREVAAIQKFQEAQALQEKTQVLIAERERELDSKNKMLASAVEAAQKQKLVDSDSIAELSAEIAKLTARNEKHCRVTSENALKIDILETGKQERDLKITQLEQENRKLCEASSELSTKFKTLETTLQKNDAKLAKLEKENSLLVVDTKGDEVQGRLKQCFSLTKAQMFTLMSALELPWGSPFLMPNDFTSVIGEVAQNHPGLAFASATPGFHRFYAEFVIARIFFSKTNQTRKYMTYHEFIQTGFLDQLLELQVISPQSTRGVFSYKLFYVIYQKFVALDADGDALLEEDDLDFYEGGALTPAVMANVAKGFGRPLSRGKWTFQNFTWLVLCRENKAHRTSIGYWFRTMDQDGDGKITLYDLETFFHDQAQRMEDVPAFTEFAEK
ncbi:Serine/threonine-protein phosphatase 2A regulatory subunit B'' subunit alpha, partial [Podochytrium sp. JEL0797]